MCVSANELYTPTLSLYLCKVRLGVCALCVFFFCCYSVCCVLQCVSVFVSVCCGVCWCFGHGVLQCVLMCVVCVLYQCVYQCVKQCVTVQSYISAKEESEISSEWQFNFRKQNQIQKSNSCWLLEIIDLIVMYVFICIYILHRLKHKCVYKLYI